jgi:excisionase family DNA binding protein
MEEPKAEKPEKLLCDIGEVCAWVGMSYRSIHRAVRDGRIQSVRCGGAVKIPRREVERILARGF